MLYVMRHGQTDWNIDYRLQGSVDIPLNETGREMAKAACDKYRNTHIDVCYCSPLSRARETAELVLAGRDIPIVVEDLIREANFGEYEGQCNIYEHPDWEMYKFFRDPANYCADKGAESFEEMFARADAFIEKYLRADLAAGKDVLVVGHGAMSLALVNRIEEIPLGKFWDRFLQNCELDQVDTKKLREDATDAQR